MKIRKLTLIVCAVCFSMSAFAQKTTPNIVFVLADDQRANTVNYLGNEEIITPNLDKLAQSGTYFANTYIMGSYSGAVCQPSRAMLLTGKYPPYRTK